MVNFLFFKISLNFGKIGSIDHNRRRDPSLTPTIFVKLITFLQFLQIHRGLRHDNSVTEKTKYWYPNSLGLFEEKN